MRLLVVLLCLFTPRLCSANDWTPPKNPSPNKILQEAKDDAKARKFQVALAKHIWYHENALSIEPSQTGVRLSFALSAWLELGEEYPPALAKLREIRDQTREKVLDKDRVPEKFGDFHDLVALNKTLRQEEQTVVAFLLIDETDEEEAARLYSVSQAALLKHREYAICGKYLDPEKDVDWIGERYRHGLKLAERIGERYLKYVEEKVVKDAGGLVGVLVKVDRNKEANQAAEDLKKLVSDKKLAAKLSGVLESALKGKLPKLRP